MTRFAGKSSDSPERARRPHPHRSALTSEAGGGPARVSFDGVTECLLYAMLAFSPFAFGVVAAWSREVFLLLVAAAAVVVCIKHLARAFAGRSGGFRWSWAYPVMLAFVALCAAQAVPLPAAWVGAVSPGTLALKAELLSDLPDVGGLLRRVTLSFYPRATVEQTLLVAAVAAVFVVVLDVFREPARIRRLLTVIASVGLAVACLSAYLDLTGATTLYGGVAVQNPNSGPFMNHSHFSQFMNLSVGAALALLLDRTAQLAEFYRTPTEIRAALFQWRNGAMWLWVLLCVAGPVLVMLSFSRGGLVSLGVATVVTGGLLLWRGRTAGSGDGRAWVLVGLGLAVFAVVLYVGFDLVSARMATLSNLKDNGGGVRREILRDIAAEFKRFPLVGTGLGTHEFVFGLFDTRNSATVATHAENEYAQLLEETGAVGVGLGALFLIGLAVSYWRAVRRPTEAVDYVAFGAGFGLIAILVHSASDFGQHLPANAALTAVYAALLTGLARRRQSVPATKPASRRVAAGLAWTSIAVALAAVTVGTGLWADRARRAEALWNLSRARATDLESRGWQGDAAAFADLIGAATAAVALEPTDVDYRYWTDTYRWLATPHDRDPKTQADVVPPAHLPAVRQVVADMAAARVLCPTHGLLLSMSGQINRDALGQGELGERQIRLSYRLAPFNPSVCLIAGADALNRHQWAEADAAFGRYTLLGGAVDAYADACLHLGQPQIPYKYVKHDRGGLLYLAGRMPAGDPRWAVWVTKCRREAAQLLANEAAQPGAAPGVLAEMADADVQQGKVAEASDLYRRALADDYGNIAWRLRRAHCLVDANRPAEAVQEAQVVLRLRPEQADAADLVARWRGRTTTAPSP